ncbi:hypothetical protein SDRG_05013 [Saprolegnia diclina VS20]|uniref:Uncharacterized protein n=1 Tax=Saprolegnia diclina (strain VS20) TaxID=1156394 RepID=T0QHI2_SAPDV|nr:hypothetical protein SDRG_05013 [Saprolegnia diclina VS20]EQC37409.1 hypothetical protein SDRG_05013 [Saprolegnia diclina VS20]|eukprot:XP_008608929.1 hypothetical protein SDRG_05013 [Saprolegnia diclina VS20]
MAKARSKTKTKAPPPPPPPPLPRTERAGPFTPQEVVYVEQVADDFRSGLIDDVPNGTHLRQYLSMLLRCQPMRLSKRFIMSSNTLGLCIYNDKWYDGTTDKAAAKARREALRVDFEQSVLTTAPYVPPKTSKHAKKALVKLPERTLPARNKKRKAIVVSYPESEPDLGDHIGRMSIHRLLASTTKKKRRVSTQEAMHLMSFARRLRDKVAAEPPVVLFDPPPTTQRRARAKVDAEKPKRKRSHAKRRTARPWDSSSADESETETVARPWEAPYRDLKAVEFSFRKRTRSAVSYNDVLSNDDDDNELVAPPMQHALVETASHIDDERLGGGESLLVADNDHVMGTPLGAPVTDADNDTITDDDAADDNASQDEQTGDEPAFAAFAPSASDAFLTLETVDLDSFEAMDFEHNLFEKTIKMDAAMDAIEIDILTDLSSDFVELEMPSVVTWTL